MSAAVLWFRRDLRLGDHPALLAAAEDGPVVALFVLDDALLRPSGAPRIAFLYRTLRALDAQLREHGGALTVRRGQPEKVVPAVARECGATSVHVSGDFAPYGAARDERVAGALGDTPLVRTGSPYAVAPGRVTKGDGTPFRVYTAFYRAWAEHGWRAPAASRPGGVTWRALERTGIPVDPDLPAGLTLPEAGEAAALTAWRRFRRSRLDGYDRERDRPDLDRTSRLSPYLKFGSIHPRTMLAGLRRATAAYRREIAWREFYADLLCTPARTAPAAYFQPAMAELPFATGTGRRRARSPRGRRAHRLPDRRRRHAPAAGRGLDAQPGADDRRVVPGQGPARGLDARRPALHAPPGRRGPGRNQHGWQWAAGTGTDAAPYFRIFNPARQGESSTPTATYVRRYVPELAGARGREIHEPWRRTGGLPDGYPERIVDHAKERSESLANYQGVRDRS